MNGDNTPSLDDFEKHLLVTIRTSMDTAETADALRALETIRMFRKDYLSAREYLK